jgi:hypothetical protein
MSREDEYDYLFKGKPASRFITVMFAKVIAVKLPVQDAR